MKKNNKWYKLGFVIGFILTILLVLLVLVGAIALEGLILYGIELTLFPLIGWTTSVTYIQCCAIALCTEIVVGILKNIFKRQD